MNTKSVNVGFATVALLLAGSVQLCRAEPSSQPDFPSAEEASRALFQAVQNDDEQAVGRILGAGSDLIGSNDAVEDQLEREHFAQKYEQMHRLTREADGSAVLYIGAENWPFPIPLVSRNGAWRFDTDVGGQEILFRRIGENEVTAIDVCHELVAAPGAHHDATVPISTLLASAGGGGKPAHFKGYYFRMLSRSGERFTAIAYPDEYRSSGVMTFVVDQDGIVYEKDLGPNTAKIAGAMTVSHPDRTWAHAETRR